VASALATRFDATRGNHPLDKRGLFGLVAAGDGVGLANQGAEAAGDADARDKSVLENITAAPGGEGP